MRFARSIVGVAALCAATHALGAQFLTTRGLFVGGVADTSRRTRFVARAEVFSAFEASTRRSRTFASSEYQLGALVDVVRLPSGAAIGLVLGTEMAVAPDNSIGFDPRGILWDEQVSIFNANRAVTWSVAAFLRCRHDVDNTTAIEARDSPPLVPAEGRVIVLRGAQIGFATREWSPMRSLSVRAGLQLEGYLHAEDIRTPASHSVPDWRSARGASIATARARAALTDRLAFYARGWASGVFFSGAGVQAIHINDRGEIGVHLAGPAAGGDVFFVRERTFDDAMTPLPRRVSTSSFGVRLAGPSLF